MRKSSLTVQGGSFFNLFGDEVMSKGTVLKFTILGCQKTWLEALRSMLDECDDGELLNLWDELGQMDEGFNKGLEDLVEEMRKRLGFDTANIATP
jgi:hypothetical protein